MKVLRFNGEFFNIKDTLECGQIFRFKEYKEGFLAYSKDKAFYCYNSGDFAIIECQDEDEEYVKNLFDLSRDYKAIYESVKEVKNSVLKKASDIGKGIRIRNQDISEMVVSFIISQNNNIPRIKNSIEKLCQSAGEKREFLGEGYYTFPSPISLKDKDVDFYKSIGLGYRAEYLYLLIQEINKGFDFYKLSSLKEEELYIELLKVKGIGPKVAECIMLFGYHKTDVFPTDTWVVKAYKHYFGDSENNAISISNKFVEIFGELSGFAQQYLFYQMRENKIGEKL
jgi:N-glycosylase/DNA lyase